MIIAVRKIWSELFNLVLILDEKDVGELIDIPSTVQGLEEAFKELGHGKVLMPVRTRLSLPGSFGTIRLMPAALVDSKISGLKVLAGTAGHRKQGENYFVIQLHDYEDGALKCIMSANRLTQLRTGALSAVATRLLARKNSKVFGLIGAGVQGRGQLEAICSIVRFEEGFVFDISQDNARKLAEFATSKFNINFKVAESIEQIAKKADVLSTSTTSSSPIINSSMVSPGTHINAIGSNLPSRRELDDSILRVSKIFVDSRDQAIEESGDLEPIKQGRIPKDAIFAEISEALVGSKPGRVNDSEITIFKSVGVALQDIATANLLYNRAIERGIGKEVGL